MAFAQIYILRGCPQDSFPALEEAMQACVGGIVYGNSYPEDKEVSASAAHATLGRFMELEVRVDTEDLPGPGWLMTLGGLCIPDSSTLAEGEIFAEVPEVGLTEKQLYDHHKVQSRQLTDVIASDGIWSEMIGWRGQLPPKLKVGALVVKAQGAWHATDSGPEA